MASVKIRVDSVSQLSGGSFQVNYTILAGTEPWQPNQTCQAASQAEVTNICNAKAAEYLSTENQRQSVVTMVGNTWDTGLNIKWPLP